MSGSEPDGEFRRRLLRERSVALAARGAGAPGVPPSTRASGAVGTPRLVCATAGSLVAVETDAVASLRPFRCWPMPLLQPEVADTVLGVILLEGRLHSVLCMARLLGADRATVAVEDGGGGNAGGEGGGTMLVLRRPQERTDPLPDLALRVDRVLGVLEVEPLPDGRRGLVRGADVAHGADHRAPLAILVGLRDIVAAVRALDRDSRPCNDGA